MLVEPLARADAERDRPPDSSAVVAAICATTAGWYRMNGHVTPVASSIADVRAAAAASIEKAKPECSCSDTHGWK
jgi:hypothetical protein